MGKLITTRHIPYCKNIRVIGLQVLVHLNLTIFGQINVQGFEPKTIHSRLSTRSKQDRIAFNVCA